MSERASVGILSPASVGTTTVHGGGRRILDGSAGGNRGKEGKGQDGGVCLDRGVVIETGAVVEARYVGEGTVVEVGARVGRGSVIGKVSLFCWQFLKDRKFRRLRLLGLSWATSASLLFSLLLLFL